MNRKPKRVENDHNFFPKHIFIQILFEEKPKKKHNK